MTTNRTSTHLALSLLCFFVTITTTFAQKPIAVNDNVSTLKNVTVAFKPTVNDTLNGKLTSLGIVKAPSNGSIGFLTLDSLLYQPAYDKCDYKDTLIYFICNDNDKCDTASVFFNITCTSITLKRPNALNDTLFTEKNVSISFNPTRNDTINGTTLVALALARAPQHGSIGFITRDSLVYLPKRDTCNYQDSISYVICNESNLCDTATIYIYVSCPVVNSKPIAQDDRYTTRKNTPLYFKPAINDNLNGSQLLALGLVFEPKRGSVGYITLDSLVYIPHYNVCGSKDTISYKICNEAYLCDTANIVIDVTCQETFALRPYLATDYVVTPKNKSIRITPLSNDLANGKIVSLGLSSSPVNGSLTFLSLDTILYQPKADFCGKDSFIYHICNERFQCDTGLIYITVSCDNISETLIPVIVTFRVKLDATQTAPVHIAGDFQEDAGFPTNWDATATRLKGPENGFYSYTDTIFNKIYQYKFLKNNTWQDLVQDTYAENARFDLLGCGVANSSGKANRLLNLTGILEPYTRVLVSQDWNNCSKGIVNSYSVKVTASPSIGGTASGAGLYFPGDSITVKATTKAGYRFINWTESTVIVSRDSIYKFILPTGARDLVANFEKTTSVNELPESSVIIYPNPTSGHLTIQMDNNLIINELKVLDILGREILRGGIQPNQTTYNLDLTAHSKGIYLVYIKTEKGQITKRILVK